MNKLHISSSVHICSPITTRKIMIDVVISLIPSVIAGSVIFGGRALIVIFASVAAAVLSEHLFCLFTKRESTVCDFSAVVTGIILGLNLHADIPIWQVILGALFASLLVKCLFGGIGQNFANPAAAARVFLIASFSGSLSGGAIPKLSNYPELVSGATVLEVMKNGGELPPLSEMFLGLRGGSIGETCAFAIILGFVYLVAKKVINFEAPLVFVLTIFILYLIADKSLSSALYGILAGSALFASVFMITDYSSTPITRAGRMIFAFACAVMTFLIRRYGSYPEGVSFAILIMNILTPYIEKITQPKPFGGKIKKA